MSPPASTAAVLRIPPVTCSRGSTAPEPDAEGRSECSTGRLIFAMLFGPFPTLRVEAVYDVIGAGDPVAAPCAPRVPTPPGRPPDRAAPSRRPRRVAGHSGDWSPGPGQGGLLPNAGRQALEAPAKKGRDQREGLLAGV